MTEHADGPSGLPALAALREGLLEAAARDQRELTRNRHVRPLAGALAMLALLAAVAAVLATRDDGTGPGVTDAANELIARQPTPNLAASGPEYATLGQLVANSELIVAGTVAEVRSGGEIVDIDPEYPTRFVDAVVTVEQILKGADQRRTVTIRTLESAYAKVPGGSETPDLEWRRPGERIVAFLASSPEGGRLLVPTSYSQSFYRLRGSDVVPLAAKAGSAVPLSDLVAAVRAAGS